MKAPRITPDVRKRLTGLALLGAVAALGVVLIPAGTAAPSTKPYTANICEASQLPSSTNTYGEKPCPEPSTPPVLTGPSAVVYLSIHNRANPQQIGSANVTLPISTPSSAARHTTPRTRRLSKPPAWDRSRCHHGEPDHPSQPQPRPRSHADGQDHA